MKPTVIVVTWVVCLSCTSLAQDAEPAAPEPSLSFLSAADAADMAVERSPRLGSMEASVAAAWARVRIERAAQRIALGATVSGMYGDKAFMVQGSPTDVMDMWMGIEGAYGRAALRASLPVYTGGRLEGMEDSARHAAEAKEEDLAEDRLEVRLTATLAYRQALLAQAIAQIASDQVMALEERVRVAEQKLSAGKLAEVDVHRQRAALADGRAEQVRAEGDVEQALVDLRAVLSLDQDTPLGLADPLAISRLEDAAGALVDRALATRPAMVGARERVLAAGGALNAAAGADRPQVYAFGGAVADAMSRQRADAGWMAGLSVSFAVSDGGRRSARQAEARAVRAALEEDERQVSIQIERDVTSLLIDYRVAMERLALAEANVASAEEAYRVTSVKYDAGKTIVVDLLDSIAMRTRAHMMRAVSGYQAQVAVDRLSRALGEPVATTEPEPLLVGWERVSLWRSSEGEVSLTLRAVAPADLLGWLARTERIPVRADDEQAEGVGLTGVFRGTDVTDAVRRALASGGLRSRWDDGCLVLSAG